jgi:hypothetical protein
VKKVKKPEVAAKSSGVRERELTQIFFRRCRDAQQ